ncbi:hypothetical protein FH972_005257 [Carpinus fangiana]|uniref:Phytocyanin domain-containing protein n=1 Tax=Carpinus fangiana TaxID=176857 RepID=A0A5N6QNQ8_9ROSI|nr:hypothetical protein FH972_005257 [Carpinus fangiana]
MEEAMFSKYCSFLIMILMANLLFLKGCTATSEVHTVGDDEEWNDGKDFFSWSQKYNFSVGDVLRFKYVKGQHNAYEVRETTYRSCDASSGVLAKYESGDDQVKLNQAKKYWFICNVPGHCLGGMRFGIDVKEASAASTSSQMEASPPLNSCKSYVPLRWRMGIFIHIFALGILLRFDF